MANQSNSSSGFISASASSAGGGGGHHENDNEEACENSSLSSPSSSSGKTLGSFKSFIQNYTQPYTRSYTQFATSYLCQDVPFDRILCDDSDSYEDIEIKFVNPVAIQEYKTSQKSRQALGPSVRKKFIVPSTQQIWRDIDLGQRLIEGREDRLKYLYLKARQWCEVNKALSMDHKYPKPDVNVVRRKYSSVHQKAVKLVRKDMISFDGQRGKGNGGREPIFCMEKVSPYSRQMMEYFLREVEAQKIKQNDKQQGDQDQDEENEQEIFVGYDPGQDIFDGGAKLKWDIWKNTLEDVFAEITPLSSPELQKDDQQQHWQAKAAAGSEERRRKMMEMGKMGSSSKMMKKRFWKRNTYPPMTMEDRIAEKRKLLPPHKPEGLDMDYLSGIWEPALMVDEFRITSLNYDSRLEDDGTSRPGHGHAHGREVSGPDPISWWDVHEATQKCWKWLKTIPDNL